MIFPTLIIIITADKITKWWKVNIEWDNTEVVIKIMNKRNEELEAMDSEIWELFIEMGFEKKSDLKDITEIFEFYEY